MKFSTNFWITLIVTIYSESIRFHFVILAIQLNLILFAKFNVFIFLVLISLKLFKANGICIRSYTNLAICMKNLVIIIYIKVVTFLAF